MLDRFALHGRVALVTGAGRGLGRAIGLGLAQAGADVAGAARSTAEVDALAADVRALGREGSAHEADISRTGDVDRLVAEVVERHGRIDILVNNAGVKIPQDAVDVTEEAWDLVLGTNLRGAFFCAQAVGRHMLEQGGGKIVNVASTYAVIGAKGRATYAISKGGLVQLTRALAIEWASHGINVNAVGPTSTNTPMNQELFGQDEWQERALARIPAGRFCEPDDVANAVVFLASPAASMIHGQLLLIDGGLTIL